MKRVLLAINGNRPTKATFQFAVGLCRQINAELNILQFIKGKTLSDCFALTRKQAGLIGRFMEDSFAGVAFAEHGLPRVSQEMMSRASAPLKDLLLSDKSGIVRGLALSDGNPETELSAYVETHTKIILTVFDPSEETPGLQHPSRNTTLIRRLKKKMCVPLVQLRI